MRKGILLTTDAVLASLITFTMLMSLLSVVERAPVAGMNEWSIQRELSDALTAMDKRGLFDDAIPHGRTVELKRLLASLTSTSCATLTVVRQTDGRLVLGYNKGCACDANRASAHRAIAVAQTDGTMGLYTATLEGCRA